MSSGGETRDSLPGEAMAIHKIGELIEHPSIQTFMDEFLVGSTARERFTQVVQGVGYAMFLDGLQRPGMPVESDRLVDIQAAALVKEADLFSQGVAAGFDRDDEIDREL